MNASTSVEQVPEDNRADSPYALLCSYAEKFAALELVQTEEDQVTNSHLAFSVGEQYFLLRVHEVRSVLNELQSLTRLPFAPPWLVGLSSVRGEIVSVVAFAQLIGQDLVKSSHSSKIEQHYILLGGEAEGFLLKVEKIYGINRSEVDGTIMQESKPFIDGHASFEGKHWQRIHLGKLLHTALSE